MLRSETACSQELHGTYVTGINIVPCYIPINHLLKYTHQDCPKLRGIPPIQYQWPLFSHLLGKNFSTQYFTIFFTFFLRK